MISVKDKELNEKNYINNIVCSRSPTPNPARTPSDEAPPDSALTVPHVNLKDKDESDFDASIMLNNFEEKVSRYCLSNKGEFDITMD